MPRVHSISEIKVMLSGILGSHAELRNIKVRGKISPLKSTHFLSDGKIGIRCFVPPVIKTQFAQFLAPRTSVIVQGHITLYTDPGFNEYEINVGSITPDTNGIAAFSVSQVENQLLKIIEDQFELIDVRARGKFNDVPGMPKSVLSLKDPDDSAILCRLPNNRPSNQDREEVSIRGKICNFSTPNRIQYQIDVVGIESCSPDNSIGQCQCSGCGSCQSRTDMCPPLQDPEYELCANCYHESPDREDRVAQAVYAYFNALGGNGFSPEKERTIQVFSSLGRADVVLVDGNGSFAAIAECKGSGYVGHGIEQLNAYLSTSDAPFGIFANTVDPEQWKFYKNQGQNQFESITCDQFKAGVKGLTDSDLLSARDQIDTLEAENNQLKQTQRGLKEDFGRLKVYLESAMQTINQIREKVDE